MSQAECLEFLKQYCTGWFKPHEIAAKTGTDARTIRRNLSKLRRQGYVDCRTWKAESRVHGLQYRYARNEMVACLKLNSDAIHCANCGHLIDIKSGADLSASKRETLNYEPIRHLNAIETAKPDSQ